MDHFVKLSFYLEIDRAAVETIKYPSIIDNDNILYYKKFYSQKEFGSRFTTYFAFKGCFIFDIKKNSF